MSPHSSTPTKSSATVGLPEVGAAHTLQPSLVSTAQAAEQPSPLTVLPSSHASPAASFSVPSPHMAAVQSRMQLAESDWRHVRVSEFEIACLVPVQELISRAARALRSLWSISTAEGGEGSARLIASPAMQRRTQP